MEIVQPDSPASVQALILTKGMSTDGPTITERLHEDKSADYETVMTANGLSPAAFNRMDAWLALMSMTMTSIPRLGYQPANGPEEVITRSEEHTNELTPLMRILNSVL